MIGSHENSQCFNEDQNLLIEFKQAYNIFGK